MDRAKSQSNSKAINNVGGALRKMGDKLQKKTEERRRRQINTSSSFSSKHNTNNKLSQNRKY